MIDNLIKIKPAEKKSITDSYNRVMDNKNYLDFKKEISVELKETMNNWSGFDNELKIALDTVNFGLKKDKMSDEDKVFDVVSKIIVSGLLVLK